MVKVHHQLSTKLQTLGPKPKASQQGRECLRPSWVAVKELTLGYHNSDTAVILFEWNPVLKVFQPKFIPHPIKALTTVLDHISILWYFSLNSLTATQLLVYGAPALATPQASSREAIESALTSLHEAAAQCRPAPEPLGELCCRALYEPKELPVL